MNQLEKFGYVNALNVSSRRQIVRERSVLPPMNSDPFAGSARYQAPRGLNAQSDHLCILPVNSSPGYTKPVPILSVLSRALLVCIIRGNVATRLFRYVCF